jgi:hypothetical protein
VTSSGWAATETELARCLIDGTLLDVSDRLEDAKNVRSEVIRDLLLGRWPDGIPDSTKPDPRGLRLRGARLTERLDLDYVSTDIGLELINCVISAGITAIEGRLVRLDLTGSTLGAPQANQSALTAAGVTVIGNLYLAGLRAHSSSNAGTINLVGAHIGGQFNLRDATLTNDTGSAVHASFMTVGRHAFFNGFNATGHGEDDTVRLLGAHIGGQLHLRDATLSSDAGTALYAERLTVDDHAFFDGFSATGHGEEPAVRLLGAHIGGQLHFRDATLSNDAGTALYAERLTVEDHTFLQRFTAVGHGGDGAVRLISAHIGGQLILRDAKLTNDAGPALQADDLTADIVLTFDKVTAVGHGENGGVRLISAHIARQLLLRDSNFTNDAGPALDADNLTVNGNVYFGRNFTAAGHGRYGAVRLFGAHIGAELHLRHVNFTNEAGPALYADNLTVNGNVYFDDNFTATGRGESGTVRLSGMVIKDDLKIDVVGVRSLSGPSHRLTVDGLTYERLAGTSWDAWLLLLRRATPVYAPQPYRQLAAITTASGHDSDTRRVLMMQRRDQLGRAGLKRRDVLWGRFTGITLGYGYQPWRALIALFVVTLASALLLLSPVGARGLYVKDHPEQRCSATDRIVLGIDTALPLVTTPVGNTCLVRSTNISGQVLTAAGVTTQILGWAFATLFVAGFTGAVRKT